jgi:hypothetical protein
MYRPRRWPGQLVVEAATDEDFLSDFLSPLPDDFEESDDPDEPEDPDELDEPESPDELVDFEESEESELPDELSADDPFDPLAEPSLAAGTVLAPARLSVR